MKALITGVSGFVGNHLCELLLSKGYEVIGLSRSEFKDSRIEFHKCDIRNQEEIEQIIKQVNPEEIYHLAALSYIPESLKAPIHTYNTIINGTLNLFEAIRKSNKNPKILFVGSGEVYGESTGGAFSERDAIQPANIYAAAKACAEIITQQYKNTFGLNVILTRPFNHTGPGQSSLYACSSFARQISEMEAGVREFIQVGNINVERDFLDVRDVVNAYYMLMLDGVSGEIYNVSSNYARSISDILNCLFAHSFLESPMIISDNQKIRLNETASRVGDNSKLISQTDWRPEHNLDDTMGELLDFWRKYNKVASI
ncbi:GDP-mannose 4,6-dehydratase [Paenibacillus spiritus]|uniref:GDP-mannose 4,6-dehydratase n=1 Tax=Paenibacillus spiritus TaxID=2496557 RepID=UPI00168C0432|nr:GDP-mannose 4,6-dehydratase [Paenibacillus spiritus]